MALEDVLSMGFFGKRKENETVDKSRREFLKKAGIGAAALPFVYSGANGIDGVAKYLMQKNPDMSEKEATGLAGRLMNEFNQGVAEGIMPKQAYAGDIPEAYRKSPGGYDLWEVVNYAIKGNKEQALKVLGLWHGRRNMPELGRILRNSGIHNINPLYWFIAIEYGLSTDFHIITEPSMKEFAKGYYDYNNRDFTKAIPHLLNSYNNASNDEIRLWSSRFLAASFKLTGDKEKENLYGRKIYRDLKTRLYSLQSVFKNTFS